jgi:hypothetical protein
MKKYDYLRPAKHIVFAAKIWNGCTLYQIDGAPVYFGTKKAAAKFIRENFTGDAAAVRLYDLRNAGRTPRTFAAGQRCKDLSANGAPGTVNAQRGNIVFVQFDGSNNNCICAAETLQTLNL